MNSIMVYCSISFIHYLCVGATYIQIVTQKGVVMRKRTSADMQKRAGRNRRIAAIASSMGISLSAITMLVVSSFNTQSIDAAPIAGSAEIVKYAYDDTESEGDGFNLIAGASAVVLPPTKIESEKSADIEEKKIKSVERKTEEVEYNVNKTGWVSAHSGLTVRKKMNAKSKKLSVLSYGTKVTYATTDDNKWYAVEMDGEYGYVYAEYISDKDVREAGISYTCYNDRRKSYMSWRTITATYSNQYKLQRYAYTGSNGIRMVNGRYCIAIGQAYGASVGTHVDVTLENGKVLPCVIGDVKAYRDTQGRAGWCGADGGYVEFIVETSALPRSVRRSGSLSSASGLGSPVVRITVYPTRVI